MSTHHINFPDPDPEPGQWGWVEEFGRTLAEKRNHAVYEAMLSATTNDKSGAGITGDILSSLGLSLIPGMCSPSLEVWGVQLPDDSFTASGIAYEETRRLFVYNDSGFFTLHISRSEKTGGHYSWAQICVIRDADHLRRLIEAISIDWRS